MPVWRQRRGTAAALAAANETPAEGQIVFELDTNRIKIGNGTSPYNSLQYLDNEITVGDVANLQAALDGKAALVHTHTVSSITNLTATLDASYAPIVHVHAIGDVTGLSASLDGKAATVHTHTVSSITDAGTAATRDVPATGNATSTQVVLGSDTRLTDQRIPTDGSVTAAKLNSSLRLDEGVVI